ncbi:MAG: YoaP domain-containing protein, partial [Oscillospiraceae bacterium]|nr:YoaP domain-containing protein [Oscillospiraceae bacterium]
PFTTFALYYNGAFLTHEIQSEKKFEKMMDELGI